MVLFEMKNIKKSFGSLEVLKDISGEVINKVPEDKLVDALFEELDKLIK